MQKRTKNKRGNTQHLARAKQTAITFVITTRRVLYLTMQNLLIIFSAIVIVIISNIHSSSGSISRGSDSNSLDCQLEKHSCLIDVLRQQTQAGQRHLPADLDITLYCPPSTAIWYYEDRAVRRGSYWLLERAQAERSGRYACQYEQVKWANLTLRIGNSNRQSDTDLASFKAIELSVSKQAPDALGVQLKCSIVDGNESLGGSIRWYHNGNRMQFEKQSLHVLQLQPNDAGDWRCSINDTDSNTIRLEAPQLTPGYPQNISLPQGEHSRFDCRLEPAELKSKITWLRPHHRGNIEALLQRLQLGDIREVDIMLGNAKDLLELGSVEPADGGWYICLASNSFGRSLGAAYLDVLPPAAITTTERSTTVATTKSTTTTTTTTTAATITDDDRDDIESGSVQFAPVFKKELNYLQHGVSGKTIILACPSKANPAANITWTFNKDQTGYRPLDRQFGTFKYRRWSLIIEDSIQTDTALYMCKVCNTLGCIHFEYNVRVTDIIRASPIIRVPDNKTALINTQVKLKCDVVSNLAAKTSWYRVRSKNRTDGNNNQTLSLPLPEQELTVIDMAANSTEEHPMLVLSNVTHADEGWYTCMSSNNLGTSNASLYLHVVDHLPFLHVSELLRSHPVGFTVAVVMIVSTLLLGSAFIMYILRRLRREKLLKHRIETVHQWTKKVIIYKPASLEGSSCGGDLQIPVIKIEKQRTTFSNTTTGSSSDPAQAFNEYEFPLDSNWEIPRQQLALGSILGEGAFGRVVMAEADGLPRSPPSAANGMGTIVAVKMVKEEHTDADMASLVREMEVMKMIGKHINIINLLGCCSQNGPLWVIVEYAPHGNLKDFLKQNRPGTLQRRSDSDGYLDDRAMVRLPQLGEKELIMFAFQIARGMEYLASRRCIHRDLAARNVLVSDNYVMKIADFGLARDIQDTDYYRKNTNGRLPIKWMAPESLQEKFYDSQTDVWSYGVLLWEIMTYGEQPYPNIMSAEELYSYLITGQRMEKPAMCTLNIYLVMRQCWNFESSVRPTFAELVESFDGILQQYSSNPNDAYLDLSMPMLETPPSSDDEGEGSETETFRETSPLRYQYTYKFN
ncbi:fibroblast growth factor receptor homolog 2 [Drosophila albomicans]|uniref:receptor protein-tyrosine kinase n=1 Tax=Drosophila albomicans TaxID=7291 RepID=A0A6P8WZF8_DROAB|nr:fibroblast growth factor receptor homolog 2 [Drosophila albomicans]